MDDMDDLTAQEAEQMEETGETAEEAHRAGEFRELRDLIEEVMAEVRAVREDMGALRGFMVDAGAELRDDGDPDEGEEETKDFEIPDYDDLDFSM